MKDVHLLLWLVFCVAFSLLCVIVARTSLLWVRIFAGLDAIAVFAWSVYFLIQAKESKKDSRWRR